MILKIDHIGIAVNKIEESLDLYTDKLNLIAEDTQELSEQKIRFASININDVAMEFIEPASQDSPISNFLQKRGEGIHHIAFEVDNIDEELSRLKEKGVILIDEKPRIGAHGTKIAFFHPKYTKGVLIELVEKPEKT